MANQDAPFGAKPIGQSGGAYNGQIDLMYMPATDATVLAVGDLVQLKAGADANGVPLCDVVAAGDTPVGIVMGFAWTDGAREDLPSYKPASTLAYIWVATDPNLEFIIQEDSVGAAITAAEVGENTDIATYVAANSTTGKSQIELDSSIMASTSTLVINVRRLYQAADNEIGNNAIWVCGFNVHQYGSVGVTGGA
jgi:hypothetical protein